MDEDGAGNRSPPRARSPDTRPLPLPPSRFAAEAGAAVPAKPAGILATAAAAATPVTPATTKALSVSFVSPLAAAAGDSLPASFDSLALHDSPDGDAMSLAAPSSLAASSAFAGPASYAPSAGAGGGSGSASGGRRSGRKCSRRKLAIGSRLLKLTTQVCVGCGRWLAGWPVCGLNWLGARWSAHQAQHAALVALLVCVPCCCLGAWCGCCSLLPTPSALPLPPPQNYPPLVEARAAGAPSMSALAVFRDLSEEQWEAFMASVRSQVARKLRDGAWKQAAASKAPPMMSCPRF